MKNTLVICLAFTILLVTSCQKKEYFQSDLFEDSFEDYMLIEDLLFEENGLWSYTQLTRESNSILIDTSRVYEGGKSLRFSASFGENGDASKASIAKQDFGFMEGETVQISASYYLQGTASLNWLFITDIEERTAIGAGPGMRLAIVNNQLLIEHKFYVDDIKQAIGQEVDFPRDKWVKLIWEVRLSQSDQGTVKLWQDDLLIINETNKRTSPKDFLYFQQGTKGMYNSVEIGITANSQDNDCVMWIDDVTVQVIN